MLGLPEPFLWKPTHSSFSEAWCSSSQRRKSSGVGKKVGCIGCNGFQSLSTTSSPGGGLGIMIGPCSSRRKSRSGMTSGVPRRVLLGRLWSALSAGISLDRHGCRRKDVGVCEQSLRGEDILLCTTHDILAVQHGTFVVRSHDVSEEKISAVFDREHEDPRCGRPFLQVEPRAEEILSIQTLTSREHRLSTVAGSTVVLRVANDELVEKTPDDDLLFRPFRLVERLGFPLAAPSPGEPAEPCARLEEVRSGQGQNDGADATDQADDYACGDT